MLTGLLLPWASQRDVGLFPGQPAGQLQGPAGDHLLQQSRVNWERRQPSRVGRRDPCLPLKRRKPCVSGGKCCTGWHSITPVVGKPADCILLHLLTNHVFLLEVSKKGGSPDLEVETFRAERTMKAKHLVRVKAGGHGRAQIRDLSAHPQFTWCPFLYSSLFSRITAIVRCSADELCQPGAFQMEPGCQWGLPGLEV